MEHSPRITATPEETAQYKESLQPPQERSEIEKRIMHLETLLVESQHELQRTALQEEIVTLKARLAEIPLSEERGYVQ